MAKKKKLEKSALILNSDELMHTPGEVQLANDSHEKKFCAFINLKFIFRKIHL